MQKLRRGKIWILGLIVAAVVAADVFLLLTPGGDSARPPQAATTALNLGRSGEAKPIEQVATGSQPAPGNSGEAGPIEQVAVPPTPAAPLSPTEVLNPASDPNATVGLTPTALPEPERQFPVRLEFPATRIDIPVLQTFLDKNNSIYAPLNAAGHYISSARPGQKGNMVIVGHVRRGLPFNRLSNARLGDTFSIFNESGQRFQYKVAQVELVPVADAAQEQIKAGLLYVQPTSDERVTLVTCWPETTYANRLIVIGIPARTT